MDPARLFIAMAVRPPPEELLPMKTYSTLKASLRVLVLNSDPRGLVELRALPIAQIPTEDIKNAFFSAVRGRNGSVVNYFLSVEFPPNIINAEECIEGLKISMEVDDLSIFKSILNSDILLEITEEEKEIIADLLRDFLCKLLRDDDISTFNSFTEMTCFKNLLSSKIIEVAAVAAEQNLYEPFLVLFKTASFPKDPELICQKLSAGAAGQFVETVLAKEDEDAKSVLGVLFIAMAGNNELHIPSDKLGRVPIQAFCEAIMQAIKAGHVETAMGMIYSPVFNEMTASGVEAIFKQACHRALISVVKAIIRSDHFSKISEETIAAILEEGAQDPYSPILTEVIKAIEDRLLPFFLYLIEHSQIGAYRALLRNSVDQKLSQEDLDPLFKAFFTHGQNCMGIEFMESLSFADVSSEALEDLFSPFVSLGALWKSGQPPCPEEDLLRMKTSISQATPLFNALGKSGCLTEIFEEDAEAISSVLVAASGLGIQGVVEGIMTKRSEEITSGDLLLALYEAGAGSRFLIFETNNEAIIGVHVFGQRDDDYLEAKPQIMRHLLTGPLVREIPPQGLRKVLRFIAEASAIATAEAFVQSIPFSPEALQEASQVAKNAGRFAVATVFDQAFLKIRLDDR